VGACGNVDNLGKDARMTQPAKSQEPSMEEILASIRRIIADDDASKSPPKPAEAPRSSSRSAAAQHVSAPVHEPELDSSAIEAEGEDSAVASLQDPDILDLTESMAAPEFTEPEPMPQRALLDKTQSHPRSDDVESEPLAHDVLELDEEPDFAAAPVASPESEAIDKQQRLGVPGVSERGQLLSGATTAAVDSAFNALAQTVLVQNARTLEDLVREMLRPMLKTWLDDNLPGLVERLVRAEIERVARGYMPKTTFSAHYRSATSRLKRLREIDSRSLKRGGKFQRLIRKYRRIFLERRRWFERNPDLPRNDVDVQMEHHLTAGRLVELLDGDPVGGKCFHRGARDGLRRLDEFGELVGGDVEDVARRRFRNDQRVTRGARHDVEKSKRFVVLINFVGG
jgi:cell pole-organizing protein PopZ